MRPPTLKLHSESRFPNQIVFIGLFSGMLITASIWFEAPTQIIAPLSWICLGLIGLGSFSYLRQPATPRPRWLTFLAVLAAVSLVYLFPELFGPVCGGMPRAFASPAARCGRCIDFVCEWNYKKHKEHCYCNEWDDTGCTAGEAPTIEAELTCNQWGQAGWCTGAYTLDLSATEPQGNDLLISGDVGGVPFACPTGTGAASCSIPLPEGAGNANFTATSTTGLTASGTATYKHDSTLPQINGWLNGTSGSSGWFVSSVDVNASASDPLHGSGLAAFDYNLDGGGWQSFPGTLSLTDGVHNLSLRASDAAGNTVETGQTIQVDTITPTLDLSLSGTAGANGWYRSPVQVSAAASDTGSGVYALEYDLDGTGWTAYSSPIELLDGAHTLSLRVIDHAGNITDGTQSFLVDTLAPGIDLTVSGTEGTGGWYTSTVQLSASASEAGSGLANLEVCLDQSAWNAYTAPLVFSDGQHTYQFRASDNAGNITETAVQQILVDSLPPDITLPESWRLGEVAAFVLQDEGSGLSKVRLVIEDKEDRYPKVTWEDDLTSYRFRGEINWDGRFKDGQIAPPDGEYYAWLKVTDNAGNEKRQAGQIFVPQRGFLEEWLSLSGNQAAGLVFGVEASEPIVAPVPLPSAPGTTSVSQPPAVNAPPAISFGGSSNNVTQVSNTQTGMTSFNVGGQSNSPAADSQSNLLWGAAAMAALGAFTAEIARRRQEEEEIAAARAATHIARQENRADSNYRQKVRNRKKAELEAEWAAARAEAALRNQAVIDARVDIKDAQVEAEMRAYTQKPQELGESYYRYMAQKAYENFRAQETAAPGGIPPAMCTPENIEKPKPWWEKAIDWVDSHQKAVSTGVGIGVGLLTAGLVLAATTTAVVTLPVILVAAGVAAVVAGAEVAIGTALLNRYYGRDLTSNIWSNIGAATVSAAVTTGLGLFVLGGGLTSTLITIGNGAGAFCANNQTVCNFVEPVMKGLDLVEEVGLMIKGGVQTATGDMNGAAETALELQMEHMDGGIPGNAIAKELGEEIGELATKYGDDIVDFARLYGDDAVDLIRLHKGDAVEIIREYGKDGINLLKVYGNDATNIVKKIEKLSDDASRKAWKQGPEAMKALSYWSEEDLIKYGDELVSRAAQDAKALKAASELAKIKNIDTPKAQKLIKTIANESIIGDGNRLILGKWIEGSLDDGFIGKARSEKALYYGTNPGLQKIIDSMGNLNRAEKDKLFWAINEQVLQKAVDSKWKIDYSFNGFEGDEISREVAAVEAIVAGQSHDEVAEILGKFPFRMREVEFLVKQGYTYEIDIAAQVIHWIKP